MTRQHIDFLTGAGISVESGLSTFREKMNYGRMRNGLVWQVLMPSTWLYSFYDYRMKMLLEALRYCKQKFLEYNHS